MNILQEFFYGNIDPNTKYIDKNSPFGRKVKIIDDTESKLLASLQGGEKSLFIDFSNAQMDVNAITAEEKFILGFRLGALFMIDIMYDQKGLTMEEG